MNDEDYRRVVLIEIDALMLADGLGLRGAVMVDSDLPRDVELVSIKYEMERDRLLLKLRHSSFHLVPAASPIPFWVSKNGDCEGIHIHGEGSERWTMTNSNDD